MNRQDAEVAKNLEWEEPGEELDQLAHRVIGAAIEVHRHVGYGSSIPHKILAVLASWRFVPPKAQLLPDAS